MDGTAATDSAAITVEEARLARAAAAGDGDAFAALYERYEQRAFNLAYRIVDSEADAADAVKEAFLKAMRDLPGEADGELAFGPYLLTALRDVSHGLMRERQQERASEAGSEEEGIRQASMRLPERQREVLALHELEDLSYEEIAAVMETSKSTVAQLISRARINLRDELRGTALASVAPSSECERALPLIAMREDGQLQRASSDAIWLDAHLEACNRCGLVVEAMREAGASYRAWAPIAAVPWLLQETMAQAADLVGADWSATIAKTVAARTPTEELPDMPSVYRGDHDRSRPPRRHSRQPRRRAMLAAGLSALLLLTGLAVALAGEDPPTAPTEQAAGGAGELNPGATEPSAKAPNAKEGAAKKKTKTLASATGASVGETTSTLLPAPAPAPTEGSGQSGPTADSPNRSPGEGGIEPSQQTAAPKSSPKPKPAPKPAPAPTFAPAPAPVTEAPPAEESSKKAKKEHPGQHEPPGHSADRPPH